MIKAITIGYRDVKDKDDHDVLYSGNDRDAAVQAAKEAEGYQLAEVCYPSTIGKRVVFDGVKAQAKKKAAKDGGGGDDKPKGRKR